MASVDKLIVTLAMRCVNLFVDTFVHTFVDTFVPAFVANVCESRSSARLWRRYQLTHFIHVRIFIAS